nr:BMP family ABC transporter substrate-binding protein [uncultured Pseudodesulfovibrio sp.]
MKRFTTLLCAALLALTVMPGLAFANDFTIGMILVGPYNDKGYSQAQYEGGKYVEAHMDGAKLIYLDKVNPADRPGLTIPQIVDDLVEKGADLIIAGSDDMKDGILEAAAMHPDKTFLHVSGDSAWNGKAPENLGNLFSKMEYSKMMAGFTAAMTTQTGKIGVVGPLVNEETRRLMSSAYLGASYAWTKVRGKDLKDLSFNVKWIGFWFNIPGVTSDPTQVAGSLFDAGYDVLISGIDTPEVVTVAKQRKAAGKNVWALPYDYEKGCEGQGDICLGVPYFNWGPGFLRVSKQVAEGTYKPNFVWESPYWADINNHDKSPVGFMPGEGMSTDTKTALDAFVAEIGSGKLELFTGPLNYQDGTPFLKAGEKATDKQIWYMHQMLEGMEGISSAK